MSVCFCKNCKYYRSKYTIGYVPHEVCRYKDNIWIGGDRPVLTCKELNRNGCCGWYKPNMETRIKELIIRIKNRLLYYLERARNFRP